ncbi:TPR and ankyrin repeat-containing protein 1-like [Papaver somniferum]|uniref:TPR and ankyrin repeat-containing protein 1-like n=1 Tax=Papaver somniferum TaxID=3469 RepID=UPI000E6F4B53|nr:TPR and ankyrin repeat-containing protein 1-like [Papaver somniferum]
MLVEGFQGGEEDIVIISTVISDSGGSIGSLSNPKQWNVALTRARHCLWIMGNDKTLSNSGSCWEMLVRDAKDRNCFFYANEDKELAKVLLEAKKELGQLDDLLNGDSVLFKSARWKVLFSDKFRRSFGKLKSQTQKCVIQLLLRLSSGWRPKNIKVDSLCGSSLQLVKQIKVGDLYVISTVDIAKYSSYTQVLKIWDILPVEEIPKLLTHLDGIFRMYTSEFIDYCKLKRTEQDLELPVTWEVSDDIVRFKDSSCSELTSTSSSGMFDERSCVETSNVKDSLFLMKFYSLSSGMVSHLLSGSDGKELDLPFELTDRESEVILYPGSTFILGRSGTGKTTILTMKLFRRGQQHYFSLEGFPDAENCSPMKNWMGEKESVLRQIFLTISPMLCSAVKNQISNWKSFMHSGKNSAIPSLVDMYDTDHSIESRDTPDNFINIPPESYPLVITFRKFLMMLDGSMENSYFNRFNEIRQLSQGPNGVSKTFALNAFIGTKEVNYERFSSSYWSHFNARFTKKLDSLTVFIEIISHIKGGIVSGRVLDFHLSREDYVLLSEGRVSTVSKEQRQMVYDIFLDYEKKKLMKDEFDLADLVIDLHRRLRNGSYHGEDMDFIYIDEVQDLTMRQISLLKYLCKNSMEGFAFSGDTAQTIGRGIDFRFQDIRSLFYNEFLSECGSNGKDKLKEKDQISDVLHLNQNLRTHSGVLNLSQSVIDLLYHFFPLSVDILSPETSFIHGEAPVLLESAGDENAIVTIFGNQVNEDRSMTGFGAEQVILVRDESGKKEIIEYIGKKALVLTILECKGLEFQDVLLYNYFGTTPLKNKWRLVYEYMMECKLPMSNEQKSFPSFSQTKHKMLCSELKQLYVSVTRTRQRLWICENEGEFSKPIFDYWKKLCLVQVRKVDESFARAMQVASSEADWSSRGIKLFNEGNFEMAAMCFERAQDLYRAKWAKAAGLRSSADHM